MTPALKAMVEAMWAEVERQKAEDRAKPWEKGGHINGIEAYRDFHGEMTGRAYMMGTFDLEKVAREAMLALHDAVPAQVAEIEAQAGPPRSIKHAVDRVMAQLDPRIGEGGAAYDGPDWPGRRDAS